MRVTDFPWLHVVAVVKGTAEGDSTRYFGSLLGFSEYVARAASLGLVRQRPAAELGEDDDELVLTEHGEAYYRDFALGALPRVRGYNWHTLAPELIGPAAQQLADRWATVRAATPGPA
ncbi:hypothetical protein [Amycolatopsis sp. NBC_01480]|uniref:hypothetical protein n=1 Tax=Amycolatopsis sp. NBC_01480 TaxID=2903562 RepID=UPI002E2986B0|nr:hypothetical protein [Amycolatopsis sp. NBC_01480]